MTANSSVMNARPRAFPSRASELRLDLVAWISALSPYRPHFANTTTFGMTLSANTSYVIA